MATRLPAAPPVLPGFTYIRPLGTGGFADVFLFEQNMPRRPVAVKVMLRDVVDDGLLRMFNAEADIMARLSSHPAILTIYQASISADGRPYLVMEYCPSSLTNRYRREVLPVPEVLALSIKIASAVETAHRSGLLHRDIKPSNLLMTTFGSPVLSDFGIAASVHAKEDDEVFAMSVPWSSPEVVDKRVSGSIAAEVWSLGATVYSLLAGRSPFERAGNGQNTRELLKARIRSARYTPVGRADVPPSLEAILRQSMTRDPAARQPSAAAFAYQLQQVQSEFDLSQTEVDVAVDEWAAAGTAINFQNNNLRGPARTSVTYESRRPPRTESSPMRATRAGRDSDRLDGTVLAGAEPKRRAIGGRKIVLISLGAAIIFAGASVGTVFLLGGIN